MKKKNMTDAEYLQDALDAQDKELRRVSGKSQTTGSETIAHYEDCFRRIAEAVGITTPLILLAMCDEKTDTYADALVKYVELKTSPNKEITSDSK